MTIYHYYTELIDLDYQVQQKMNGTIETNRIISTSSEYLEVSNMLERQARQEMGEAAEGMKFSLVNLTKLN